MQGDERLSDEDVLRDLLACAQAWEPDARLIGNVRAGDAVRVLTTLAAKDEEIAALRAEVAAHKSASELLGLVRAEIEPLGGGDFVRGVVALRRLRARDERTARVIEAARYAAALPDVDAVLALREALAALDDATDAGASVEERAAESECPDCHGSGQVEAAERNHARTQQRIGACLSMPPELAAAELRAISEVERAEEEGER